MKGGSWRGVREGQRREGRERGEEKEKTAYELGEEDAKYIEGVDIKNLDRSRELGNGLLADVVDTWDGEQDIRELTNDLCLRTDGKIRKEDLDAIIQWALKVREMYLDIESRRGDARDASVD